MSLSFTTRRRQQTSAAKWSSQQHLVQQLQKTNSNLTSATNNLLHPQYLNQSVRKQKSFIESSSSHLNKSFLTAHTGRAHLSRGLSVGRSHENIPAQRTFTSSYPKQQFLKKHSSINVPSCNGKNDRDSLKPGDLIKRNITNCGNGGLDYLRNSRRVQAWSSTSSILKSLDKELAQINVVVGKCKDVKISKGRSGGADIVDNLKTNNSKTDSVITTTSQNSNSGKKSVKPEVNKVNLSIVLSDALDSTKEESDSIYSDQEPEGENDYDSDELSSESSPNITTQTKTKDIKKTENSSNCNTNTRPSVTAHQRRALYHNSRLASNLTLTNNTNQSTNLNTGIQNPQNFNASPSLTVQKRPPLVRAMSAPVRSFDETSKASSFLATKRKSRRRKLNTRNISCDKGPNDILTSTDLNINRKVLTRSKSVAPDVITLVSLISSEGSDSEKEENFTPTNSQTASPTRRAPSLRKTGKSVSFQENYPPTFQFASKEYSHMLRRSSIAPLAQRIKSNRPPTAPPGSIFHNSQKLNNEMSVSSSSSNEDNEIVPNNTKSNELNNLGPTTNDKTLEEEYEFPEYVRSLKERECWKLFMKMSTKGVNITYDTILRGMLTPTEFRQLQKQRELEEAKARKEAEENGFLEETAKEMPTAIERLKESLLKN